MNRFKNILCVVDLAEDNTLALERAVSLAISNSANLSVLNVTDSVIDTFTLPLSLSGDLERAMKSAHNRALTALLLPYQTRFEFSAKHLVGTPFLEIIREVLRNNYDLVLKVPSKSDWVDRLFSSDDMHLLRKCPCPVWLIKPMTEDSSQRILAAIDVDEGSLDEPSIQNSLSSSILSLAQSLAEADGGELHVVHAWDAIGESVMRGPFMDSTDAQVSQYVSQVKQQHETAVNDLIQLQMLKAPARQPKLHLLKGMPRQQVPLLAKQINADIVVMGTVGRTGIPGFIIGNTAESIINQLDCSVLALKPAGFVSPVTL